MVKRRTSWISQRWSTARQQQDLYNSRFGTDLSAKEFFKNENPLLRSLVKYKVTIEMNYLGEDYRFFLPQETYTIYSFESPESQRVIEENTKQAVSQIFKGKSIDWVYNRLDVTTRGMERSKIDYNEVNTIKLKSNTAYTEDMPKVEVSKKKGQGKAQVNSYNLDLWL